MIVTQTQLTPLIAIVAGILILMVPRLLNYIIALYLIYIGFVQLNSTHHWIRFGTARLRPAIVMVQSRAGPRPLITAAAAPMTHAGQDRMDRNPVVATV